MLAFDEVTLVTRVTVCDACVVDLLYICEVVGKLCVSVWEVDVGIFVEEKESAVDSSWFDISVDISSLVVSMVVASLFVSSIVVSSFFMSAIVVETAIILILVSLVVVV